MPHLIFRILPLSALLCAACAPAPRGAAIVTEEIPVATSGVDAAGTDTDAEPAARTDIELCDAADYRPLIGSNIAATTLPAGPRLRVYSVDDIVTQEYIPQRTNIIYRPDGTILRVECG